MSGDIFLKLTDIKGESKDHEHKDEIHVESFSWGLSQPGSFATAGGGGVGKVAVHDIHITKVVDKASPELFLHCASGKHIKEGLLTFRKAGDKPLEYLKIKLTDVMISSMTQDDSHGSELPHESVSLNFAKINVDYQEQGADGKAKGGPVTMGWDIKANQKA